MSGKEREERSKEERKEKSRKLFHVESLTASVESHLTRRKESHRKVWIAVGIVVVEM